jgi:hypothetical protein
MNTKHTPEPWSLESYGATLITKNGYDIALTNSGKFKTGNAQQDAARIVTCVNACAGLNPAAVPRLVEALQAGVDNDMPTTEWLRMARAALAAAKGEA